MTAGLSRDIARTLQQQNVIGGKRNAMIAWKNGVIQQVCYWIDANITIRTKRDHFLEWLT